MGPEKSLIKTFLRVYRNKEMISLYFVLLILAALFTFVSSQYNFYFGLFLILLYCLIVINLFGKFVNLSRLSAEEKFKTEERDLIISSLEDGVIVYDPNFTVLTINTASEKLFGVSSEEVVGKQFNPGMTKVSRYRIFVQTLFPSLAPSMTQLSESDSWPQVIDLSFENPTLELRVTLHQVINEDRKPTGFIKIIHNMTREKNLLRSKTDFIGVAAHQLRTPLTALHWAMESIVKFSENNKEVHDIAKEALVVSERSLKITNDLLDVSKIEDGKFGFSFKQTNLIDFVSNIAKEMKILAAQYNITIDFIPPQTTIDDVLIDQDKLSSVVFNLIDNAVRYNSKNGRVTITINKEPDGRFVRVSVSDTGIGISKEDMKNLFQKLYRGSNAAQTEPNGSGLGLYIAKNIVIRHGGVLNVESELDRGSTFWFTLPLDKSLIPKSETVIGSF
ncbi:MAG: ATP-binding protein [Candidatus Jorgensenbacteria bacterium]|nr:ATP-binding protein [Candidatus Jorgensenbacteria bacterium]